MSQEDVFVINIISSVRALLLVVLVLVSMIYHVMMKKKNCCTKNINNIYKFYPVFS